jgi:glycosyltransferase involved in cell wall biosynthesis
MSSKVISIVSYKFLPAFVGGQKAIALFYKYFSKHIELICVTTSNNDPTTADGYEVLPVLSPSPFRYINVFYFFTIRKMLKNNRATHLLVEHPYYGWLAVLLKQFTGVKLVVRSHNIEGLRWKTLGKWWWKVLWRYEKFTHRHADHNLFITQADLDYAIRKFGIDPSKCMLLTYGIERNVIPSVEERQLARNTILSLHQIPPTHSILLFNGTFDYKPNLDALYTLLQIINPILESKIQFKYVLLLCGRDIPDSILKANFPNVIVAGFVQDIDVYLKSTDVFLNPVIEGGGIKTKLVEALSFNCNAVSTSHGAIGVDPMICNKKLLITADGDWNAFAEKIIEASLVNKDLGPEFFQDFYWGNNAKHAADFIQK